MGVAHCIRDPRVRTDDHRVPRTQRAPEPSTVKTSEQASTVFPSKAPPTVDPIPNVEKPTASSSWTFPFSAILGGSVAWMAEEVVNAAKSAVDGVFEIHSAASGVWGLLPKGIKVLVVLYLLQRLQQWWRKSEAQGSGTIHNEINVNMQMSEQDLQRLADRLAKELAKGNGKGV